MILPRGRSAIIAVLLIASSVTGIIQISPVQAAASSTPVSLAVTVGPAILPADDGVYAAIFVSLVDGSGQPTLAVANLTVFLSSSNPSVGTILNSSVVIHAGEGFAVADFKTTTVDGSATITASASGLVSASQQVQTSVPTGFPSQIAISAVPTNVPSLPSYTHGKIIVELQDQAGLPAKAISNTTVQLISLNRVVLNVTASSVKIDAGEIAASASYSTGPIPGVASIVATASGYQSGTAQVTVSGPPALALKLYTLPSRVAVCGSCGGMLVIAVTDLAGNPVHTPNPIVVHIRSNDTARINPIQEWTIPRGNVSARILYSATQNPGGVQITVSAAGLSSDVAVINTYTPETPIAGQPVQLRLEVGPKNLPSDNCRCGYAVVSILNATSQVPMLDTAVSESVTLTSSQAFVANFSVNRLASISLALRASSNYVSTPLTSTFVVGATTLTASAEDRLSDFAKVTTAGAVLSRISITPLFGFTGAQIPADGAQHPAFELSLFDSAGNPVLAPANTLVNLNSSQSGPLRIPSPVQVPTGRSAVLVNVTAGSAAGTSNVTAYMKVSTGGILTSSSLVTTVTPSPSTVGAYLAPAILAPSPLQPGSVLILQLQDSSGNPSRARTNTVLSITSSDTSVFNQTLQVQVPQGNSSISIPVVPLRSGSTTFTISAPGLKTASAKFEVLASPLTTQLSSSVYSIFTDQTATVTLTVSIDGQGLKGANVTWSATRGSVSPQTSVTDSQGQATVTLRPTVLGVANVTAVVSSPALGSQTASTFVVIGAKPAGNSGGILGMLLSFPYILIIVAAAAVVVVVVFLFIRRRRRSSEADDALSDEEQAFNLYRAGPSLDLGVR